jgi:hypothetical protein
MKEQNECQRLKDENQRLKNDLEESIKITSYFEKKIASKLSLLM